MSRTRTRNSVQCPQTPLYKQGNHWKINSSVFVRRKMIWIILSHLCKFDPNSRNLRTKTLERLWTFVGQESWVMRPAIEIIAGRNSIVIIVCLPRLSSGIPQAWRKPPTSTSWEVLEPPSKSDLHLQVWCPILLEVHVHCINTTSSSSSVGAEPVSFGAIRLGVMQQIRKWHPRYLPCLPIGLIV